MRAQQETKNRKNKQEKNKTKNPMCHEFPPMLKEHPGGWRYYEMLFWSPRLTHKTGSSSRQYKLASVGYKGKERTPRWEGMCWGGGNVGGGTEE